MKVTKTVRETLKLQQALQSGEKLDKLQLQKVERLSEAFVELDELECGLPAHSDLRSKNRDILELVPNCVSRWADADLKRRIREQIEYYFSDVNLANDAFFQMVLRTHRGWILMSYLLNCNRLKSMGATKELICAALTDSHLVLARDGSAVRNPDAALPPRCCNPDGSAVRNPPRLVAKVPPCRSPAQNAARMICQANLAPSARTASGAWTRGRL